MGGRGPVSLHAGQHDDMCLESSSHGQLRLWKCHGRANQHWTLADLPDGSLQIVGSSGTCVGHGGAVHTQLELSPCADGNRYRLASGRLTDVASGACLTATDFQNQGPVVIDACNPANPGQAWAIVPMSTPTVEDAATSVRVRDETAWNKARATGCALPVALTGCDGVRIYLAKFPTGAHADEANKALVAGQPQLEKLQKDDNAWQQAGVPTCRAHADKDACVGVELYLTKYAAGLHADEARALLAPRPSL